MISEANLQKFIDTYERKYSVKLDRQKAFELFSKLVMLVRAVYTTKD